MPGHIIINEILYDPDPVIGMPAYEYLELLNRGRDTVDLKSWRLCVGEKCLLFPGFRFDPGSFRLLIYHGLTDGNPYTGINTLPVLRAKYSLPNSGSEIILFNQDSIPVDFVRYSKEMHSSGYHAEGGWSLERMDPEGSCFLESNWSTSRSDLGGTPGRANSFDITEPDQKPPMVNLLLVRHRVPHLQGALVNKELLLFLQYR